MACSSGDDSSSGSGSNNSTSGSENSTDEEFVLKEKKIRYRLKGEDETHVPTKKSHSEGRRYRKQVSSSSSGCEETKTKKQRILSSVVVKGKKGMSSDDEEENDDKKEYKVKDRKKSHKSEKQKSMKQEEDYERNPHYRHRNENDRNKDRHLKDHDKRHDYNDYNDYTDCNDYNAYNTNDDNKYIQNERGSKYNREEKVIKKEYIKDEYDSDVDDKNSKVRRSKYKVEKDYLRSEDIKNEYDSETDSKDHRKRKNEQMCHNIKTENKYKQEEDITKNYKRTRQVQQQEHSNYKNHNRNNHYKHDNVDQNEYKEAWSNEEAELGTNDSKPIVKEEENYELSGKLTEYTNTYNGVVIIYNEPPEARKPKTRWRFYPFKGEKALTMLQLHRQSAFLLGRDRKVADIPVDHPSCSKQHAVLQFRLVPFEKANGEMGKKVKPYIIDLDSRNGTHVNNKKIEARKYVELCERDVIKFGFSSRDYVLLHEKSEDVDSAEDEGEK